LQTGLRECERRRLLTIFLISNKLFRFRWVACQLDALKKCRRKRDVLKTLDELPESLDETYERILLNIDKKDQPEAQRALTWLAFSVRPLNVGELAEAVVIDPQSATPFDPEERLHDPYHDVLEILGSLITISEFAPESESESESESELSFEFGLDSKSRENTEGGPDDGNEFEKLSRYVRLAHFSVKEYLLSARIMDSRASKFGINAVESNKFIAECCLLYFFHYDEWDPVEDFNGTTELLPLLPYAGERWPTHAEAIPQDAQSQLEPLVFKLFLSETAFVKWMRVFHDMEPETCSTWKPLFQASHMGLVSVVQLLLDKGADPNARDFEGATALYRAVFTGEVEVVRLLLKNGADANIEDNNSWTALQRAVMNGNLAMVCALLESGADIESRYEGQWTILHEAVEKGHTNIAKLLIEKGADIKAKDNDGWTALQRAVMKGNQTIVCALLERGADIESRYEGKWTLLHYAIWGGDTNIAKLLIEKGADVEAAGNGGWTVLHTAAQGGYKDLVRLLLEMGADIKTEYNGGWTALHTAARDGYKDVVQLLLETGADVEAKDNGGWTALHAAAQDGCEDLVEFLLENGADVHAETETEPYAGWTALHIAGYRGHNAAVQVLIEKGADPLAKTELGETVLDVAISNNSKGVVDLLSSYANQSGSRPQPRTKLQQDGSRVHQIVYE
jgi:ankyrin repeat domain-containing protein 50